MADSFTVHYNLTLPQNLGDNGIWGPLLNGDFTTIDSVLWSASEGTTTGVNIPASSATNITLTNPINNIQNISFSATGLSLILPVMNATGSMVLGGTIQINNVGANPFSILASDGATIIYSSAIGSATLSAAGSGYVGPIATGSVSNAGSGYVGPIATGSVSNAGTNYSAGTYNNVPLTGGSGTGAQGTIVVSPVVSTTGSLTATSTSVTITGTTTGILSGQSVTAPGVPSGATVISITGTTVVLSAAATITTTENIFFGGAISSVTPTVLGIGYLINDVLSASSTIIGVSGTAFTYTVNTLGSASYVNVPLTGGSGSNAIADITMTNGAAATVTLVSDGVGFLSGNVLSASNSNLGGSGSGFAYTVNSLGSVSYNNVPLTSGSGTGATANFVFTNGSASSFVIANPGNAYIVGNTLGASNANLGGSGSGVGVNITSLQGLLPGQTISLTLTTNTTANGTFNIIQNASTSTSNIWTDVQNFLGSTIEVPTQDVGDSTLNAANTFFVTTAIGNNLNSPTFTGVPAGPTAPAGTSTTQLATTAFVNDTALTLANGTTAITGTSGSGTTKVATQAYADASAVGVNQSWVNETSSRVSGTTYTNNDGRPIEVLVAYTLNSGGAVTLSIGAIGPFVIAGLSSSSASNSISFVVPSGATYEVTVTGSGSLVNWLELR